MIVVTHAAALVEAISGREGSRPIELRKELGETVAGSEGDSGRETPAWAWPSP